MADVDYLSRAAVGYSTAHPRRGDIVPPGERTGVVVHHTVFGKNVWDTVNQAKANLRYLQSARPDLGCCDVPYNFVAYCMADGSVVIGEGRGWDRSGAHTKDEKTGRTGLNRTLIGIAFAGNFNVDDPPDLADRVQAVGEWVMANRPDGMNLHAVTGHSTWKATACPGSRLLALLPATTEPWTTPEEPPIMGFLPLKQSEAATRKSDVAHVAGLLNAGYSLALPVDGTWPQALTDAIAAVPFGGDGTAITGKVYTAILQQFVAAQSGGAGVTEERVRELIEAARLAVP